MQLSSVQALKAELLSVPQALIESAAESRSFRVFSTHRATATRTLEGIALGVTKLGKEYKLAVRLQESGPLVSTMTNAIHEQAKGEVEVRYIGKLAKLAKKASQTSPAFYRARRRPLRIGSSISDVPIGFISAGSLGCFVSGRTSPHYLSMLTNNHVIANENGNVAGSPVVQQGTLDDGELPSDLVGELGKFVKLRPTGINYVDAALGTIYDDVEFDATRIGTRGHLSGQTDVATLPALSTVFKVGRTTGQTKGRVTAFDLDNIWVEYDLGDLRFDNQIEIEGSGNRAFSDAGDSGSLIVDEQLRAIGLLFAGGDEGGTNGKGLTYANPIEKVFDALKVDLEL